MTFLSVPHAEMLGVIGGLGIATVAAWTASSFYQKARVLERDLSEIRRDIRRLRHEVAAARIGTADARPVFESLHERLETIPGERAGDRRVRPGPPVERPDVRAIADQLGIQSPEAIENLLSGSLSLGQAAREMGTGRQEARLLCWLHGTEGRRPNV